MLIKGGYLVEVLDSDKKKVLWGVLDNHVFEEGKEHDEIVLWGFGFIFFGEDKEGVVGEVFIEYPYVLMIMKLWHGDWMNQL